MKICECGCGGIISDRYPNGTKRRYPNQRFIKNHDKIGKPNPNHYRLDTHWNWKGGRILLHGYFQIKRPEHHLADHQGYVKEHRIVYEEYHKCSLLPWSDVHHINMNTQDNSPGNLIAMMHGDHTTITNNWRWDKTIS